MARQKRDTKAILKTIGRGADRSELFWWMVEQHDEIIKKAQGRRINWASVCAEAAARGRTDRLGQPPSVMTAKKTWQRARKAVADARTTEAASPPSRINPSRLPKDWRPADAPPPPSSAPQAVQVRPGSLSMDELMPVRKNPSEEGTTYDPKANKARLRRIFAERSGH